MAQPAVMNMTAARPRTAQKTPVVVLQGQGRAHPVEAGEERGDEAGGGDQRERENDAVRHLAPLALELGQRVPDAPLGHRQRRREVVLEVLRQRLHPQPPRGAHLAAALRVAKAKHLAQVVPEGEEGSPPAPDRVVQLEEVDLNAPKRSLARDEVPFQVVDAAAELLEHLLVVVDDGVEDLHKEDGGVAMLRPGARPLLVEGGKVEGMVGQAGHRQAAHREALTEECELQQLEAEAPAIDGPRDGPRAEDTVHLQDAARRSMSSKNRRRASGRPGTWTSGRSGAAAIIRPVARPRLDMALVERGLFPSRARAQAAVLAGRVRVAGAPAAKPGAAVAEDADIEVVDAPEFVSRGGLKLAGALERLGLDVAGARAIDLGASTGGFTDCLLRRGASAVVAVDVGYGQLAWSLRTDPRVQVRERANVRALTAGDLPYAPDLAVADLSFISLATAWPAVGPLLDPAHRALVLCKPQFEAGRAAVGSGGVVRDPAARAAAVRRVAGALASAGGTVERVLLADPPGPRGNREFFLLAAGPALPSRPADLEAEIRAAIRAAGG
jgi:23S rRNA (cytidine1920-2'-O)/16S rRNA (cytidine1409-2'-O)-methyltransferase